MQNVALAYRQTQAGTTGQGEILVMLFDGALRFLAQAREKMQAKDYAAKGILISRALDIVNELDSSLNMELGGELANNLHQLYFLCTTRLLQANLKLDVGKLDSVVEILAGLRGAFSEVAARPEAKAACAQISARNAGKHSTPVGGSASFTPGAGRAPASMGQGMPVIMPPGVPSREHADPATPRMMSPRANPYAAQAAALGAQKTSPDSREPLGAPQTSLLAAQLTAQNVFAPQAKTPADAVQPASVPSGQGHAMNPASPASNPASSTRSVGHAAALYGQPGTKPAQQDAPLSAPATPAPPPTAATPAPTALAAPAAVSGFAGKRLAAYGKLQSR